jgi:hypothetical protein
MQRLFYRFLSAGIAVLSFFQAFSQQEELRDETHSSFLSFKIQRFFSGKNLSSPDLYSPWLGSGVGVAAEGAWMFHENIGFGGSVNYVRMEKKQEELDPFAYDPAWRQYLGDDGRWRNLLAAAGIFVSKPFRDFSVDARFLAGYGRTRAYSKKLDRINVPQEFRRNISYSGNGWWYQTGLSLRLEISKGLNFGFNYDYFFSRPQISFTDVYKDSPVKQVHSKYLFQYGFHALGFGLYYNFSHYKAF